MRECGVAVYGVSRPQRALRRAAAAGCAGRVRPVGVSQDAARTHSYVVFLHNFNNKSSLAWRKRNKFHNTYHDFSET